MIKIAQTFLIKITHEHNYLENYICNTNTAICCLSDLAEIYIIYFPEAASFTDGMKYYIYLSNKTL